MNKSIPEKWWLPEKEGGFFGEHYVYGDDSSEGPCSLHPMSLAKRTLREVAFLKRTLRIKPGQRLLDCPAGYGRHSIELAKQGVKVTGIDLNSDYIALAEQKTDDQQLRGNKPEFLVGDMRSIPIDASLFDFGINMFTSFGFFFSDEDNIKVLKEISRALKSGGLLAIHFDYNYFRIVNGRWNNEIRQRSLKNDSVLFVRDEYDPKIQRISGIWEIVQDSDIDTYKRSYSLRLYSPRELMSMLVESGFYNIRVLGNLDKAHKLNEEDCESVFLAEKK